MKASGEKVTSIVIDQIQPFPNHPFQVNEDEAMERLKESISLNGVLTPRRFGSCRTDRIRWFPDIDAWRRAKRWVWRKCR